MKSLPKALLFGLASVVAFAAIAWLLTSTVTYHPFGVPEPLREKYHRKVAELERRVKLAKQADEVTRPVVVVDETSFDFGMVDPHATLSHGFKFRNQGELPLQLTVAETSCKCTVGTLGNNLILPGEETEVTMTWNTGKTIDEYEQTALVTTNDPLRKQVKLTVAGEIRAKLVAPHDITFQTTDLGKPSEASFLVYSQYWEDFQVSQIESDLRGFQWSAEPIAPDDIALLSSEVRSAWRVSVSSTGNSRGVVTGNLELTVEPSDGSEAVVRKLSVEGKVRAPINFYSPDIHYQDGLDIGTLVSGQEYQFHVVVRSRSDEARKIEVLDVQPEQLQATVKPIQRQPGSYQLTLKIPKDCPTVMFNADTKHGFVQVGDPHDETFSNWFPVMGAVVTLDK